MKLKNSIFYLSALFAIGVTLPALGQQRRLVTAGCRQGSCSEEYYLGKRLIHSNNLGGQNNKLFEIDLEIVSDFDGTNHRKQWAYCSIEEPFVAFDFPNQEDEFLYFHYLSPANTLNIGGYNQGSLSLYWAVCHDQFDQDIYQLATLARQLGYSEHQSSYQAILPKSFLRLF
jgi:hypothetical protein